MAVTQSPASDDEMTESDREEVNSPPPHAKKKRNTCPGVRIVGKSILYPVSGRACHQCRQKTKDVFAAYKPKKTDEEKICTQKYCYKCLLNRYGEIAEVVRQLSDWQCPKCRNICSCSASRKKIGIPSTGCLTNEVRDKGLLSVAELLPIEGPQKVCMSLKKRKLQARSTLSSTNNENSWLQALEKFISESNRALMNLPSDCFAKDGVGYESLDPSKKLRLMNFLCDESLQTGDLGSWIEVNNSKLPKRTKEAKGKVVAAKEKEKLLKQKMAEVAKAYMSKNGDLGSIYEHENLVSQIKAELSQAHAETIEAIDMVLKKENVVGYRSFMIDMHGPEQMTSETSIKYEA